jgi:hypothetical protein
VSEQYQRRAETQQAKRTIKQFTPLINKYANKFHYRAQGLGAAMEVEDIRQELSLIFLRCVNSYDESKGGSFMNFVISAWFNEMNRLMRKDQSNREVGYTLRSTSYDDEGEEAGSLFDHVDSGWATPEQNLEATQSLGVLLGELSPPARLLVETLIAPPDAVCRQFELQQRGSKAIRDRFGVRVRAQLQLNLGFLCDLFCIPDNQAKRLQREIEHKTGRAFLLGVK